MCRDFTLGFQQVVGLGASEGWIKHSRFMISAESRRRGPCLQKQRWATDVAHIEQGTNRTRATELRYSDYSRSSSRTSHHRDRPCRCTPPTSRSTVRMKGTASPPWKLDMPLAYSPLQWYRHAFENRVPLAPSVALPVAELPVQRPVEASGQSTLTAGKG